jgi:hypothetical protein
LQGGVDGGGAFGYPNGQSGYPNDASGINDFDQIAASFEKLTDVFGNGHLTGCLRGF